LSPSRDRSAIALGERNEAAGRAAIGQHALRLIREEGDDITTKGQIAEIPRTGPGSISQAGSRETIHELVALVPQSLGSPARIATSSRPRGWAGVIGPAGHPTARVAGCPDTSDQPQPPSRRPRTARRRLCPTRRTRAGPCGAGSSHRAVAPAPIPSQPSDTMICRTGLGATGFVPGGPRLQRRARP
jgi:hypothetical protein